MKTLATAILLLVLLVPIRAISQTTLEEYNYVTKGYQVQIQSGLDMKKGYNFEDITTHHVESGKGVTRQTEFKALFKEGQKKPSAILCIYTRSDNGFKDFICIPQFNSEKALWDSTWDKIATYEGEGSNAVIWGLAKLSSFYSMK